ncbi:LPD29 domain-containing protein [Gloeothece verrucosa]|uniref:Large polyvalent protein associated domain-containing protein n=1 Tax=Gloeothece verrucosa (strain PCC 7822) TaxID=497965 RepID=E0UN47_GLOV7|nr:LPD29 domain-containing protein [Gloeothece verrucosa]ADN18377.1 hypothetical protein Cyan7822_6625 [Gloeothece verrucosa PCC 7822]
MQLSNNPPRVEVKEIAKEVKLELSQAFQGVKFSVKSTLDKITIAWTDGPTQKEVLPIAKKYLGIKNNYADDTRLYEPVKFRGKMVSTYLEYVFTDRKESSELYLKAHEYFTKKYNCEVNITVNENRVEIETIVINGELAASQITRLARQNTLQSLNQSIEELATEPKTDEAQTSEAVEALEIKSNLILFPVVDSEPASIVRN